MKVKSESEVAQSCPTLATPWTAAHQAPPSMGFSRQKYWSGVPLPSPPNIPNKRLNSQVALVVKNLLASAGDIRDTGLIPGWEDPLEKEMAPHSSILAWRVPWTEEPGGL